MSKAILGRKLGMTQIFTEEGTVVPVTVVESGNNVVIMNKTVENDGYNAVQIGFGEVKEKRVTKPLKGHFAKAGVAPVRFIREMRLTDASEYNVGDTIGVDIFAAGDLVDVTGTSKGKGFAGTIKRHNFARGPMGHGSKSHREPGSTGAMISGHGGRVLKGHGAAPFRRPRGRGAQPHPHQGRNPGPEEGSCRGSFHGQAGQAEKGGKIIWKEDC